MKKSLYGLKRAIRAWYMKIDHLFINLGFTQSEFDYSIYVLHVNSETLVIALYFDDLFITRNNIDLILGLKKQLLDTLGMTDLDL